MARFNMGINALVFQVLAAQLDCLGGGQYSNRQVIVESASLTKEVGCVVASCC
ncbi:MAG: hypothetical protein WCY88_07420 [Spongiibacteraceae bacterium]